MIAARPRTSLDRVLVDAPMTEAEMRVLIKRAWRERGVAVFLAEDLARMHDMARRFIETEMAKINGARA